MRGAYFATNLRYIRDGVKNSEEMVPHNGMRSGGLGNLRAETQMSCASFKVGLMLFVWSRPAGRRGAEAVTTRK